MKDNNPLLANRTITVEDDAVSALTGDSADNSAFLNLQAGDNNNNNNKADVSDPNKRKSVDYTTAIHHPNEEDSTVFGGLVFDPDQTPIYGREGELAQLETAFANTTSIDRQLVLLEGTAGTGKSVLAYQLRTTVAQKGGFFLGGKYEQPSSGPNNNSGGGDGDGGGFIGVGGDEPYAAVTGACRELCDVLLTHREKDTQTASGAADTTTSTTEADESNDYSSWSGDTNLNAACSKWNFTFEDVQTKLKAELEPNVVQVLTTVFPDLTQILGGSFLDGGEENHVGYNEAKEQFKYAIRRLLRIISSFGPIVLFLDDVQWADSASLDLLKNLITDCKISSSSTTSQEKQTTTTPATTTSAEDEKTIDTTETGSSTFNSGSFSTSGQGGGKGLMVLASYRTEEVSNHHPFHKTVLDIEKEVTKEDPNTTYSVDISEKVIVKNLDVHQVNELLRDILKGTTLQETASLAECIHSKTEGNALYVIQFLKSLSWEETSHHENNGLPLLRYNKATSKWEWDIEEIRLSQSATQNVVQMIQQKIQRLPEGFRKLLPVVALLGASFDSTTLHRVVQHFNKIFDLKPNTGGDSGGGGTALSTDAFVSMGEREGVLMLNCRKKEVCFGHDKIQEAALELVDKFELSKLGIQLGRFFMQSFSEEEQDKNIFIIVNLLTVNTQAAGTDENRIFLSKLNFKAGTKSLRSAAVNSAVWYLGRAIGLLPQQHWMDHYDLCLDLYSTAAEANFAAGEFEKAQESCEEIHAQFGMSQKDKQRADLVHLHILGAQGHMQHAYDECIRQLAELGCKFPKIGQGFYIMGGILKVEMTMKSLEKQIQNLPIMKDPARQHVMILLDRLATHSYSIKSDDVFVLSVLKSLQYTVKYGTCDYTPPVLGTVGILLGAVLGDHDANHRFGNLALDQYKKSPPIPRTAYARTLFVAVAFNIHLHESTHDCRKKYFEGYKAGMALGDIESAFWLIFSYLESGLHVGLPLASLEKTMHMYTQQMMGLQQENIGIPVMALWCCVSNLLGYSDYLNDVDEENPMAEKIRSFAQDTGNTLNFVDRIRFINSFLCGDYTKVASLYVKYGVDKGSWDKIFMSTFCLPKMHFMCSMAFFALFHNTNVKAHKKTALKEAKITLGLSNLGNPCLKHYGALVSAEKLALDKKSFPKAVVLFKQAIELTQKTKIVHDEALANERLGDLYLRHGKENEALTHFKEAEKLYEKWGSTLRSKAVLRLGQRASLLSADPAQNSPQKSFPPFENGVFVISDD